MMAANPTEKPSTPATIRQECTLAGWRGHVQRSIQTLRGTYIWRDLDME
jgi:hypothetical protein